MLRWTATFAIGALLVLAVWLPETSMGRRGNEALLRSEVAGAVGAVGKRLPDFTLPDLEGTPVTLSDLRGHRVLLTFERNVDW